jgi:hypothetical protein
VSTSSVVAACRRRASMTIAPPESEKHSAHHGRPSGRRSFIDRAGSDCSGREYIARVRGAEHDICHGAYVIRRGNHQDCGKSTTERRPTPFAR